jgi:two-component system CitB family sensor kinase/two-component system sensor histidine kinase DcuS
MFILVFLVVFGTLVISGAIFTTFIGSLSKAEIGKRALDIGHTVALMPIVATVLKKGNDPQGKLSYLANQIRKQTNAQFVVIADRQSRRFSHPDPEKIGKHFVGGDETAALDQGRAYVSEAVGTLGPSLRSIVPVFDSRERVIGFVSVGYLQTKVLATVKDHQREPATLIFMLFVVVMLGATGIAGYVKKQTLGLEPREISSLYLERQAILESIRDGIIAVGERQDIRLINPAARRVCGFESDENIIGKSVDEVFGTSDFKQLLQPHPQESFREVTVDGQALLLVTVPIKKKGRVQGMVASFRRLEDFHRLRVKLRQTQQFSEMLRVQAHEYSNKLHTLSGLLQMGAYPEALELVTREASGLQSLIQFLNRVVPHPAVAAIIMGKYNRALEMKVAFLLNADSTMGQIPEAYDQDKLVTILGNLLDNALEAAQRGRNRPARIQLFMTDMGHDLIFEVEDSGPGVSIELQEKIFSKGYSSKHSKGLHGEIHGVGLYLVDRLLTDLNGQLTVSTGELGGALFTLSLPKHPEKKG